VIGTGTGALPVMDEVKREAQRRKIELLILPTAGRHRGTEAKARRNKRDSARDVLMRIRRVRSFQDFHLTSSPATRTG